MALWEGEDNGIQAALRPRLGGAWQSPVVLSQGVGAVGRADIALDPAGGAVLAAWPRGDTVDLAAGSATTGEWQMPVTLASTGQSAENPHVAVDARGDALAAWESTQITPNYRVYKFLQVAYRSTASGGWQAPSVLSSSSSGYPESSSGVALDPQGNALAVWVYSSAGQWTVEAASRPVASGAWQTQVAVSATWPTTYSREVPGPVALGAQVAFDAHGDAIAVWEHYMQGNWFIEAAIRRPGSEAWQPPVRLSTAGLGGARSDLSLDAQGDAVVVWEGATATQRTIEAVAGSAVSGVWRAPVRLTGWHRLGLAEGFLPWVRVPGSHATPAAKPQVAIDGHGDAVAVWEHAVSYYKGVIQAARMSSGSDAWQKPVDVAAASTEGLSVALDEQDEAISAWGRIISERSGAVEVSALAKLAITGARLSSRRFRVGHRGTRQGRRSKDTNFYFTLSEPAEVKIAITHDEPGVRSYDGCVAPSSANARFHPESCVRRVTLAELERSREPAGFDSLHFSGRVAHHALRPGTYRAIITASTAQTASSPVTLSFTILR